MTRMVRIACALLAWEFHDRRWHPQVKEGQHWPQGQLVISQFRPPTQGSESRLQWHGILPVELSLAIEPLHHPIPPGLVRADSPTLYSPPASPCKIVPIIPRDESDL